MAFEILKMPRKRFRIGGSNIHQVYDDYQDNDDMEMDSMQLLRWLLRVSTMLCHAGGGCARRASQLLTVSDCSIPNDPIMSKGTHKPWRPLE
jgi:hypothetical protein